MAAKTCQVPAPAVPAAPTASGGVGNGRVPKGTRLPRRGQVKEKIVKDVVAAVASIAAGLVKNGRGGGGLPAISDDADDK